MRVPLQISVLQAQVDSEYEPNYQIVPVRGVRWVFQHAARNAIVH